MTSEKMYEMIGDIDEKYVEGARKPMKKKMNYKVWGTMAACLCMVFVGAAMLQRFSNSKPNPEQVQVVSPILEVGSVEEMEKYLDYKVPVLEKEVKAYIVLVIDGYPRSARIEYADGGTFNMEYGTGDISGIYGGIFEKEEKINDVRVSFYRYTDDKGVIISYGIWEKNGFTYSLSRAENLAQEIQNLTK